MKKPPTRQSTDGAGANKVFQEQGVVLDPLECAIIRELCEDGRKPFQAIAREVGVDEKTVRNRVSKLRESGVLRIVPSIEGNSLRNCIVSLIAITFSDEGRLEPIEVAERISSLPMVSWVGTVMGRFDLIAEIVADSRETLSRFQMIELPAIRGVGRTEGFLIMSHHGIRGVPFIE